MLDAAYEWSCDLSDRPTIAFVFGFTERSEF